ncbi:MAG: hypothetical protein DRJ31_06755 [Candidatus Methanomethylicota archaeon]|uniref:Bacterial type II secretion system protein E domain-containing protein n=1 Tax=Thermoproteota archaeon TaxID=2056631 RepID=A0A497EPP3_9CREN|nr:MAG: hypothetical protein DRJ31_06755 [Candidatus Verstraetearchaeota archaeon]
MLSSLFRRVKKSKSPIKFKLKQNVASISTAKIIDRYSVDLAEIFITDDGHYLVQDPPLKASEVSLIESVIEDLVFILPEDAVNDEHAFLNALKSIGISDGRLTYFIKREVLGYGVLEPVVKDQNIEDIILPSPNTPVSVNHADYGRLTTNIMFSEEELTKYIERIVHLCGKAVSLFNPMISLRLPDGTRFTATYKNEVSYKGSSLMMRKFPEKPWSITMMLCRRTINSLIAAWLMLLIEFKKAMLIVGGIGSGKTSMINALCNLIPEGKVIVTVEDTQELSLAHSNWIPLVVRDSLTLDGKGEIGMFELLKHALRMSADYIIVGEVRGEEGRIWAQAMLTGHGGITSLHSESPQAAIERLLIEPIRVDRGGLTALHAIMLMKKIPIVKDDKGKVFVRRALSLYDFEYDLVNDKLNFYKVAWYDSESDDFHFISPEDLVKLPTAKLIMEEAGWDEYKLLQELDMRERFLRKLAEEAVYHNELLDYKLITKLTWKFYENPQNFDIEHVMPLEGNYFKLEKEQYELQAMKALKKFEHSKLKFCYQCGKKLPTENTRICPFCGEIFPEAMVSKR